MALSNIQAQLGSMATMSETDVDLIGLVWAGAVWLVALTAAGAFFMGQLFETVKSHSRRIEQNETDHAELRDKQAITENTLSALKATVEETRRYSVAIYRKVANQQR